MDEANESDKADKANQSDNADDSNESDHADEAVEISARTMPNKFIKGTASQD